MRMGSDTAFGEANFIAPISLIIFYVSWRINRRFKKILLLPAAVFALLSAGMYEIVLGNAGFIGAAVSGLTEATIGTTLFVLITDSLLVWSLYKVFSMVTKNIKFKELKPIEVILNSFSEEQKIQKESITNSNAGSDIDNIQSICDNLGLDVTVTNVKEGMFAKCYFLKLNGKTKISTIRSFENEIAIALGIESVFIKTNKGRLFIEIANRERKTINLLDIFKTAEFKSTSNITVPIGFDNDGNILYYDISKFPHLLIAGETGGGKSVFMHTLLP